MFFILAALAYGYAVGVKRGAATADGGTPKKKKPPAINADGSIDTEGTEL